jgi:hypothetical protein
MLCRWSLIRMSPVQLIERTVVFLLRSLSQKTALKKEWRGFVWMNPPFGSRNSIGLWLDKLYSHGSGIGLTPDRTSCPWWQKAAREANCVLLISRKVKFIRPDGTLGGSPSTGTSLFGYGKMAEMALINASSNGLGLLFKSVN